MSSQHFARNILWTCIPILVGIAYFFGPSFQSWINEPSASNAPHFVKASLTLQRAEGQIIPLKVEVAKTPREMAYGLMFRKSLAHDAGMIFIEEPDQIATFWMENTLIPLDMVFIGRDGLIKKIVKNAKPLDLTAISSDVPVHGILEINGGDADSMKLAEGDRVLFPSFGDDQ